MPEQNPGSGTGGGKSAQLSVNTGDKQINLGGGAIATIAGVALLAIFMLQNRQTVSVDFLFWTFHWRLWLLVLVSAIIGALLWFGLGVLRRHRRREHRREERREERKS
jgi:uncharacterized integral membrane protein